MPTSIRQRQSQSQTPGPARGADERNVRLTSLKNQRQNTPLRTENPVIFRSPAETSRPQCPNKECPQSKVEEDGDKLVCMNCGFVVQESQITQELTFGEASNGAAIVQGAFVGENDTAARNPAMAGNRMGGGMSNREQTERNGSHFMNSILTALRLQTIDKERGMKYFKLASTCNFIQGRVTRYVAAVCLYLACRGDNVNCKVMLIDFADILEVNVFKLGQIYNDLVGALHLQGANIRGNPYECNPENLIQRFAQDMDFGPHTHKITKEAVGILKRMRRDWIYTGRRPAGICGAALILAARMNNFRRTVREVVYTAKVADVTINKRLDEFKYTDASKLTVNEFRSFANTIETEADPPSYYKKSQSKKKRKNAKRKRSEVDDDEEEDNESVRVSEESESAPDSPRPLTQQEADTQAMPPPAIPIDPRLQTNSDDAEDSYEDGDDVDSPDEEIQALLDGLPEDMPRRRGAGRPKGSKNRPLPEKTETAIADEAQIEAEMEEALNDPEVIATAEEYHQTLMPTPPPTQQVSSLAPMRASSSEVIDLDSVVIYEHEFEDDPAVRDCLLSEHDRAIKEAVWVTNNSKWLLDRQAKAVKKELLDRSGTARVPQKRQRIRKRLGDMRQYETVNEDGTISRPTTADEATRMMLQKRGYSKKINYDRIISGVYDRSPSEQSGSSASEPTPFLLHDQRKPADADKGGTASMKTKTRQPRKPPTKASVAAVADSSSSEPISQQENINAEASNTLQSEANEEAPSIDAENAGGLDEGDTVVLDENEGDDPDEQEDEDIEDEGADDWKKAAGLGEEDEDDYSGSGEEFE